MVFLCFLLLESILRVQRYGKILTYANLLTKLEKKNNIACTCHYFLLILRPNNKQITIMNTKNLLRVSMVVLCSLVLNGLMTGCRHQNTPEEPEDPKAAFARAEATVTLSEDMLKVLDITVDYYNNAGELKQELVTTSELKLDTKSPLPTKAGLCLTVKIKDGIDIESYDHVVLETSLSFKCGAVDENDVIVGELHKLDGASNSAKLIGAHVQAWVDSFNKVRPIKFLYEFDAEGNSQKIDW